MRNPRLTVDGVIIEDGHIVLIQRDRDPFRGRWALPGGFVNYGETVEAAVVREIFEETGLHTCIKRLVGVYSEPDRDPRGHTVSVTFLLTATGGTLKGGDDAFDARWFGLDDLPSLAFDHDRIVRDATPLL
jgi:8-oxo-dGTP diphosphatase